MRKTGAGMLRDLEKGCRNSNRTGAHSVLSKGHSLSLHFSRSSSAPNADPKSHFLRRQFTCMQEEGEDFPQS
jgi:hypothetical protein